MDKILATFGQKLKYFRNFRNLSQEQLALAADMDRSYISDIERGLRNISLRNIEVLAQALELEIYDFFLADNNILEKWEVKVEDLERLIFSNPSLRGFILGYLAEAKLREQLSKISQISNLLKYDDHDRTQKHDLVFTYKTRQYSIEIKSLQTNTIKRIEENQYQGKFQCDAPDKRKIILTSGEEVTTTCLRFGDFDIVAVNMFAFRGKWEFAFALNQNLPASNYAKYPEEVRKKLIKSIIPLSLPLELPFTNNIITLLEYLHQAHAH